MLCGEFLALFKEAGGALMRKLLVVMAVLAIVAPASAGNLDPADAIPWNAPWGPPPIITDLPKRRS